MAANIAELVRPEQGRVAEDPVALRTVQIGGVGMQETVEVIASEL